MKDGSSTHDGLSGRQVFAYKVGHLNNDLMAAMWFSYQAYFLTYVVKLEPHVVGLCMFIGQIVDGSATPIVGLLSDKFNLPLGKRNSWYLLGSLLTVPSFVCIFVNL